MTFHLNSQQKKIKVEKAPQTICFMRSGCVDSLLHMHAKNCRRER